MNLCISKRHLAEHVLIYVLVAHYLALFAQPKPVVNLLRSHKVSQTPWGLKNLFNNQADFANGGGWMWGKVQECVRFHVRDLSLAMAGNVVIVETHIATIYLSCTFQR